MIQPPEGLWVGFWHWKERKIRNKGHDLGDGPVKGMVGVERWLEAEAKGPGEGGCLAGGQGPIG